MGFLSIDRFSFSTLRFIQMTPQHFFHNLPPSESKDILQNLFHHAARRCMEEKRPSQEERQQEQTSERCVLQ